ncbi:MAG: enoyl-CoA hydratase/isomerase family protein [Syntrophales bacterium]|nr:enoyl-CoA hydratase/isomerase family protein [Syntrophales bacterium]
MDYRTILLDKRNAYAIVTMNRQREMNALCREMRIELDAVFEELEGDDSVRAVIITGGNYIFSSGMDLKEMSALPDHEITSYFDSISRCLKRIYTLKKPVLAAVGGIALGGGFNLAVVSDMIIASESAIFGHPELRFGINPFFSPLRHLVGMAKAKEITMIGEPIGAKEALRIGLVNKVEPPEAFMEEAIAMAERLAERSAMAIAAVKRISDVTQMLDKSSAVDFEFDITSHLFSSIDRKMRMSEFVTREFMEKMKKNTSKFNDQ